MSFFEILFFAALSVGMFFVGHILSERYNALGWLVVVPVIYLWLKMIFSTINSFFERSKEKKRPRPICYKGKCKSRDYMLLDLSSGTAVFRCHCGDKYLSQGTYFSRLTPGGSIEPYMKQERGGEWKPNAGEPRH